MEQAEENHLLKQINTILTLLSKYIFFYRYSDVTSVHPPIRDYCLRVPRIHITVCRAKFHSPTPFLGTATFACPLSVDMSYAFVRLPVGMEMYGEHIIGYLVIIGYLIQ